MINYFEWPKRKISITTLKLDSENPRLTQSGKKNSQSDIIDYLIENEKVIELAKSIIQQNYFLNEQPIVTKENNKFIVLEGNRRVTACKILLNPDLIKSDSKRTQIKRLLKNFDIEIIKKLEVYISPDRPSADQMIVNRHTGGSVVERWDKTKQDRFIHNRFIDGETIDELSTKFSTTKGEIKKSLKRYNVFNEIRKLQLDDKYLKDVLEETKFSMTNVERVYESKYGRDFLGLDFNDNSSIKKLLPKEEFEKRLSFLVKKILDGEINSRSLNTEDDKKKYFDSLSSSKDFDFTISLDESNDYSDIEDGIEDEVEDTAKNEGEKLKVKRTNSSKLFGENIHLISGNKRIDRIFNELKSLNLKNHTNAVAVLMRSYIDMLTYQYLKTHNEIDEIKKLKGREIQEENDKILTKILNFYQSKTNYIPDEKFKNDLKKELKLSGGVPKNFIPSLKFMLSHIVSSDLLEEPKMKSSLQSHLNSSKKIEKIIGHNEFNNLVHNEYYPSDSSELQEAWEKLFPILEFMVNNLKKK